MEQLKPGSRVGPYEIVSVLGAGGMGVVYRARDPRLNRDVALKMLPEGGDRKRFEHEARAVAALDHPNIVSIYDVGEGYFVEELVEGQSLRGAELARGALVDVFAQIAEGLAAAHAVGLVHRDLKPENVIVTR